MRGNKVQITLTIDEVLLDQADIMTKRLGVSRSALVSMALRQAIDIGIKL
jgi:metal-responsive CopG/Arc/MetJ family transcriptional regulator